MSRLERRPQRWADQAHEAGAARDDVGIAPTRTFVEHDGLGLGPRVSCILPREGATRRERVVLGQ